MRTLSSVSGFGLREANIDMRVCIFNSVQHVMPPFLPTQASGSSYVGEGGMI